MWYEDEMNRWRALKEDLKAQDARVACLTTIQAAMRGETNDPTNHLYEASTLLLPQYVYQEPRISIESRVPGDAVNGAVAMKFALESEMKRQCAAETWEAIGADFLAVMGVGMVTMQDNAERHFRDDDLFQALGRKGAGARKNPPKKARRPIFVRLSPRDFCYDADANTINTVRRMAHSYVTSKSFLDRQASEQEAGAPGQWNRNVISTLKATSGERRRGRGSSPGESLGDDEVRIWEMWVPGVYMSKDATLADEKSPLFHGTIFTMAEQADGGVDVREPYLYRGPAVGPYQIYWATPVPDQCARLSLFQATEPQRLRHAADGVALSASSANYKRVAVTSASTLATEIDNAEHDSVIFLDGVSHDDLKKAVHVIEVGGPSQEMILVEQRSSEQLDRVSGLNENKRGVLAAGSTATEAAIANEAGDMRVSLPRASFHRSAKQSLEVWAWQMWHGEDVVIPLPLRAADEIELEEEIPENVGLLYQGGDGIALAQDNVLWEDLMLDIVPYSMQRTSETELRQKGTATLEMVKMLLEIALADTAFPISEFAEDLSTQMNMPGLGRAFRHLKKGKGPKGGGGPSGFAPPKPAQPPAQILGGGSVTPSPEGNQTGSELAATQR